MSSELFFQSLINALMLGLVYMLIASGLTLIFSIMHIANFAHGEFYAIGGFGVYYFASVHGISYGLALVLSITVLALIGVIVERVVFRRLRDFHFSQLVVSLGIAMVIQGSLLVYFGGDDKGVTSPLTGVVRWGDVVISKERLLIVPICILLIVGLFAFIKWTKPGQAIRAMAQNPELAASLGIDINRMSSLAFAIGVSLAGAAGGLIAPIFLVNPFMGGLPTLKAFVIICLGGMGSLPGAVVGGLILGFVDSFGAALVGGTEATMMAFGLLIIVLVIRPQGILGHA